MNFATKTSKHPTALRIPPAPAHLSAQSKSIWRSVLTEFSLAPEMQAVLQAALENLDLANDARAVLRKEGLVIDGKRHPAADLAKQADSMFLRGLRALALDVVKPGQGGK